MLVACWYSPSSRVPPRLLGQMSQQQTDCLASRHPHQPPPPRRRRRRCPPPPLRLEMRSVILRRQYVDVPASEVSFHSCSPQRQHGPLLAELPPPALRRQQPLLRLSQRLAKQTSRKMSPNLELSHLLPALILVGFWNIRLVSLVVYTYV